MHLVMQCALEIRRREITDTHRCWESQNKAVQFTHSNTSGMQNFSFCFFFYSHSKIGIAFRSASSDIFDEFLVVHLNFYHHCFGWVRVCISIVLAVASVLVVSALFTMALLWSMVKSVACVIFIRIHYLWIRKIVFSLRSAWWMGDLMTIIFVSSYVLRSRGNC